MNENTHTGHRERVRRRVSGEGLRTLEPHEVIEFLLYYILPRGDVNAVAHRLIERFGNVSGVLRASVEELRGVEGIGERAAEYLVRVGRTAAACRNTDIEDRLPMGRYDLARQQLISFSDSVKTPSAYLLCLDMDGRLLYRREVTASLSWGEPDAMRSMLSDVLSTRARCAMIALYGARTVRSYDIEAARELAYILHECGVLLLDTVLLSDEVHSMRSEGLIPEFDSGAEARALCANYLKTGQ